MQHKNMFKKTGPAVGTCTEDDLRAWSEELQSLGIIGGGDPGMTRGELAAAAGVSRSEMWRILARGLEEGKYVKGVGYRIDERGIRRKTPVYRVVESNGKKE
jgi:DNA-binding Lrp family transcriptional regulator